MVLLIEQEVMQNVTVQKAATSRYMQQESLKFIQQSSLAANKESVQILQGECAIFNVHLAKPFLIGTTEVRLRNSSKISLAHQSPLDMQCYTGICLQATTCLIAVFHCSATGRVRELPFYRVPKPRE